MSLFEEYVEFADTLPYDEMIGSVLSDDPSELADTIAARLLSASMINRI